jgi:hypothetical protein
MLEMKLASWLVALLLLQTVNTEVAQEPLQEITLIKTLLSEIFRFVVIKNSFADQHHCSFLRLFSAKTNPVSL